MIHFWFAEHKNGPTIYAEDLVAENRSDYGNLICPSCRQPMRAAIGEKIAPHFRHQNGEECSDYKARVIEKVIAASFEQHQSTRRPYQLIVPPSNPVDLAKSDATLIKNVTNAGHRVDLRFSSPRGEIDLVVARRQSDIAALDEMSGFRFGIDARAVQRSSDQKLVRSLETAIDTSRTFIDFRRPNGRLRDNNRAVASRRIPIERQSWESTDAYRMRIFGHSGSKNRR